LELAVHVFPDRGGAASDALYLLPDGGMVSGERLYLDRRAKAPAGFAVVGHAGSSVDV
jgi:hypothetical protein